MTPLHYSVQIINFFISEYLLNNGAAINIKDRNNIKINLDKHPFIMLLHKGKFMV